MKKSLFQSQAKVLPVSNAINAAGAAAYNLTDAHALAQFTVTNCFNNTFYASAEGNLDKLEGIVAKTDSTFIAKCAVYGRETANMKDMPAYLLAVLVGRGEISLVKAIFDRVITNAKMLCNFVKIIRSGKTGRKSFGTATKKLIQNWLVNRSADKLFNDNVGHSDPSLTDIIKMVHPKAKSESQNAMFAYILGRECNVALLPEHIRMFEALKKNNGFDVPSVDFRLLSNISLSQGQWESLALGMPWNTLRMNLNNIGRHGVFNNKSVMSRLVSKLSDKSEVEKNSVFPYQLLTAYQNTLDIPVEVRNALQMAMEHAVSNTPEFDTNGVAICIDTSGSMSSPVTGYSATPSKTRCIDAAALFGVCLLRRNPTSVLVPFDVRVHSHTLNPFDSIMTNATALARYGGGGTACDSALAHLNAIKSDKKVVIFVSDNESWYGANRYGMATRMQEQWEIYKRRVKGAKLVCIDIIPNRTSQVQEAKDVLNVGGFSDGVWDVVKRFVDNSGTDFVKTINEVSL